VQKKMMVLLVALLLSIITMGGCSTVENKGVTTTNKYPDRPITLIVPFGVGGGTDLVARLLEKSAPTHLGQPLVIINKPGGAGTLGWNELAGAAQDGYTLGMTSIEVLLQPLYGPSKYNFPTALDPLVQISDLSMVMAVRADQPWKNLNDLIDYAKHHPGQLKFGHAGIGGISHIAGETFAKTTNIHLEQVPFQSAAESTASLLGGHIQILIATPASVKEHLKNGTIRVLAVAGEQRLSDPVLTNIPTFREQGFDIICSNWYGIAAPKDLPADVKSKLTNGLKAMINDPEFKKNIEQLGLQVKYLGPKESEEKWLTDRQRLTQSVQEAGILEKIKAQKK
jgi:tripartite-type tricarboxylate transporter receptor subunit TctC